MVAIQNKFEAVKFKTICAAQYGVYKLEKTVVRIVSLWTAFVQKVKQMCAVARKILPGSMNRITTGEEYTARFPLPSEGSQNIINLMERFTGYQLTSETYYNASPITYEQREKMGEIIRRNDGYGAAMNQLLDRCANPKFTRKRFDGEDVRALDRVNFELLKDFIPDLTDFFNSRHMDSLQNDIENRFNFDYYDSVIAEILARTVAYNGYLDGETLSLPVLLDDGTYEEAEFTIKLYRLGDELPAYVLECKDEEGRDRFHPWFVVRGTETNNAVNQDGSRARTAGYESILADFIDPDGVAEGIVDKSIQYGRLIYNTNNNEYNEQESLAELFQGRQFKLTGHSLGGAIVNHITAHLYDNVEVAFGFSAPGVSDATKNLWDSHCPDESKIINIQAQGDGVPAAGKRLIGTHLALTHLLKPENADAMHVHVLMCLTKPFTLQFIDKELEEEQTGRKAAEIARRTLGTMLKWVSNKLNWQLPDWYVNRHIFRINYPEIIDAHA